MPKERLEEILGLDVPPVPEISLAGITCNEVLLYWKQPEDDHFASLKFDIVVNGITGRFSVYEVLSTSPNSWPL